MGQLLYSMRRANGDWFSLETGGRNRVLAFRTLGGAWRASVKNPELMLFRPAPLDERALAELATADDGRPASFWLADEEEAANLRVGHALEFAQVATLEGLRQWPMRPVARAPRLAPGRAIWAT